jgi:hypothetical protein
MQNLKIVILNYSGGRLNYARIEKAAHERLLSLLFLLLRG